MPLDQDTIRAAGLDQRLQADIASREGERSALLRRSEEISGEQAKIGEEITRQIGARGEALAPAREAISARLEEPTAAPPKEEKVPSYERPRMDPKEMEQTFSMLMIASMLVGVASRHPFYGTAEAMNGAMQGMMKGDQQLVEESMKTYDKNVAAIKERNASYRREYDDVLKKDANDLSRMKANLELLAAKYDDPIALQEARQKTLTAAQKQINDRLRTMDTAVASLERTGMYGTEYLARERSKAAARGVTPSSVDVKGAMEVIDADPRFGSMDFAQKQSLARHIASRAKSLTADKSVEDYGHGIDIALDELIRQGKLAQGREGRWSLQPPFYTPGAPATFQTQPRPAAPAPGGAPATGGPQPMPATKDQLQAGVVYQTARGPARWNGTAFEAQ